MMDARISSALPTHPKTKKLARRLGTAGQLGCVYLFLWAAANRSDGDLSGMTDEDIELAVDWAGEEGAFVAAMVDVGFLDGEEGRRSVHDWSEHNPWAAGSDDRKERARFAVLCRDFGRQAAIKKMPEYAAKMGHKVSTSDLVDDRSDDLVDRDRSSPNPPNPPNHSFPKSKAGPPDKPAPSRSRKLTFGDWVKAVKAKGEKPIPPADPLFAWAETAGIPDDFLLLAWRAFEDKHRDSGKRYIDWRATFRNAVKGNWMKVWYFAPSGECLLTTVGVQWQRAERAA